MLYGAMVWFRRMRVGTNMDGEMKRERPMPRCRYLLLLLCVIV